MTTQASSSTDRAYGVPSSTFGDLELLRSDLRTYYEGIAPLLGVTADHVLAPTIDGCALRLRVDAALRDGTSPGAFQQPNETLLVNRVQLSLGDVTDGTTLGQSLTPTVETLTPALDRAQYPQPLRDYITDVASFAPLSLDLRGPRESSYDHTTPGVIQLNQTVLRGNDEKSIEAVYHESLHAVFYALSMVRALVPPGYRHGQGLLVEIPWGHVGGRPRRMDGYRCLMTLHVYAHVAQMYAAALTSSPATPQRLEYLRTSISRALFFIEALSALRTQSTSDDTQALTDELAQMVDAAADLVGDRLHAEAAGEVRVVGSERAPA